MTSAEDALHEVVAAQRQLEHADVARADAMARRDAALRTAQTSGVTYGAITAATGLAATTIARALRRR